MRCESGHGGEVDVSLFDLALLIGANHFAIKGAEGA